MAASMNSAVVVWEWQNEYGQWRPYSPNVSTFLEKNRNATSPLQLGSVDSNLYQYTVDLNQMCQMRQGTGTFRKVKRNVYPPNTPVAQGIFWQWEGDIPGCWQDYDVELGTYIEDCYAKGHKCFNLQNAVFRFPYQIDFVKMQQIRIETGRCRQIRRIQYPGGSYPTDVGSTASSGTSSTSTDSNGKKRKRVNKNAAPGKKNQSATFSGVPSSGSSLSSVQNLTANFGCSPSTTALNVVTTTAGSNSNFAQTSSSYLVNPSNNNFGNSQYYSGGFQSVSNPVTSHFSQSGLQPTNQFNHSGLKTPSVTGSMFSNSSSHSQASTNLSGQTSNQAFVGYPSSSMPFTQTAHSLQPSTFPGPLTRNRYNQTLAAGLSSNGQSLQPTWNPGNSQSIVQSSMVPASYGSFIPSYNHFGSSLSSVFFPNPSHSLQPNIQSLSATIGQSGGGGGAGHMTFPHLSSFASGQKIRPFVSSVTNTLISPAVPGVAGSLQQQNSASTASTSQTSGGTISIPRHNSFSNKVSKKGSQTKNVKSDDVLHKYMKIIVQPPEEEDCCICCEKLSVASGYGEGTPEDFVIIQLDKCSHMFHRLCLFAMYENGHKNDHLQCPTCKTIYGEKQGNCPRGIMEYNFIQESLPGYEGYETIQINYTIQSGIQGPEHPHPGKRFSARAFPRIGFLPANERGKKILLMLIIAWKRRLTFTIGSSTTTGEPDTVTWNEIHHKTELGSNFSGHGYPDPKYLDNVTMELAIHGITEADI
ncbi:hypothetical protein ACJMK2_011560 [Sinanodonta woodiana]|uniref:E3 ubiquitin-protein ligase n=1 Tax=Sinanodonta woodiana TaxID=1069815 RepID=A0ABD3V5I7_SINWO